MGVGLCSTSRKLDLTSCQNGLFLAANACSCRDIGVIARAWRITDHHRDTFVCFLAFCPITYDYMLHPPMRIASRSTGHDSSGVALFGSPCLGSSLRGGLARRHITVATPPHRLPFAAVPLPGIGLHTLCRNTWKTLSS